MPEAKPSPDALPHNDVAVPSEGLGISDTPALRGRNDAGDDESAVAGMLEVARISRAHGLKGDVSLAMISNRPERFAVGSTLRDEHGADYEIIMSRSQGDRVVVHIRGIDSRDGAEAKRGVLLFGAPMGPLPDGELWVHELVGSSCRNAADGGQLGMVVTVQQNPAHDMIVLDTGLLIPMVFVKDLDAAAKTVTVELPDGLLEIFEA